MSDGATVTGKRNVGPGEIKVYYHEGDWEHRAELVTEVGSNLKAPGLLVGYSDSSPEEAISNLWLLLNELNLECEPSTIVGGGKE